MANDAAWQAGVDIATKQKDDKKKKSDLLHQPTPAGVANPSSFKKGGKVKKTGVAKVHKHEVVLTAKQAKQYGKKKASTKKRVASKG